MNVKDYQEKRFDSFLNKTIIYSSKYYFKNQMKIKDNEKLLVNDDEESIYSDVLDDASLDNEDFINEEFEDMLDLKNAINMLSAIEQAVIFLLFEDDLTIDEIAKILKIYTRSVKRIKKRALKKLKIILEGEE